MESGEGVNKNPAVSIITPTYNSEKTLQECLESVSDGTSETPLKSSISDDIKNQDYPGEVEIIIADAGSTDGTLEIASEYTDRVYQNPLKTGEAGKAVGVKHARGEIIALIDSDNILPAEDWLARMTAPFADPEIAGTEPLYYTERRENGIITWYNAQSHESFGRNSVCLTHTSLNDPLCLSNSRQEKINKNYNIILVGVKKINIKQCYRIY